MGDGVYLAVLVLFGDIVRGMEDWRARKRAATRRGIREQALRLFLEKGFAETTVEEIVAAAGVSHMTFFRYFKTKEDAAVGGGEGLGYGFGFVGGEEGGDEFDVMLGELLAARPVGEPVVEKFRHALVGELGRMFVDDGDGMLVRARFVLGTPALRGRLWDGQEVTRRRVGGVLARVEGVDPGDLGLQVAVAACLATALAAVRIWVEGGGIAALPDVVDAAFRALGGGMGSHHPGGGGF